MTTPKSSSDIGDHTVILLKPPPVHEFSKFLVYRLPMLGNLAALQSTIADEGHPISLLRRFHHQIWTSPKSSSSPAIVPHLSCNHPPSTTIEMRAFMAFFAPCLPRTAALHPPPRGFVCTYPSPTPSSLRELYTINEPADLSRAIAAGLSSSSNLHSFLRSRPVPDHALHSFDVVQQWRMRHRVPRPLCLDAGCGSGRSTVRLAQMLPHCDVIGVDKSASKLERTLSYRRYGGVVEDVENALLIRADLIDFWRLCLEERVFPEYHFILYPNPYPKPKHFKVWKVSLEEQF